MEKAIESLDLDKHIGTVTLTSGSELPVPKLSLSRLIKVVKFVAIDGAKLYRKFKNIIADNEMDEMEKFINILEGMEDEQLARIFSIMLDLKDHETLSLDLNEMLSILVVYSEKVDFLQTYSSARLLAKNLFKMDLPETPGEWMKQLTTEIANIRQQAEAEKEPIFADGRPIGTEVQKILDREKAGQASLKA